MTTEDKFKKNELLANHTTLRIGGPAKYFFEAKEKKEKVEKEVEEKPEKAVKAAKKGLAQEDILNAIAIDQIGNTWFGTDSKGVSVFDGSSWVQW